MTGQDIIDFRAERNLSQAELASRLRVNQSQVSRWEKGGLLSGPVEVLLEQIISGEADLPMRPARNEIEGTAA